jgi:UDP-N-acetylmuramoylalanine--D-glutamate ligase
LNRWIILGGGVQGIAAAELLARRGASVTVSDVRPLNSEQGEIAERLGIPMLIGGDQIAHLKGMTHAVLSPGISPRSPLVTAARQLGLQITNEIDLALEEYKGNLLAVTGTNGKSTTCSMIHHLLRSYDIESALVGNIGLPPSSVLARTGALPPNLVIELSSYQLETASKLIPAVICFTSFSHDHIERHGSEKEYFAAKWKLISAALPGTAIILPDYIYEKSKRFGLSLPNCKLIIISGNGSPLSTSCEVFSSEASGHFCSSRGRNVTIPRDILGEHNQLNALMATLSVAHLEIKGITLGGLAEKMRGFEPLPHRCRLIGYVGGFPVVDDSKSTNLESTQAALSQFNEPVILMLGGRGKGESFAPLRLLQPKIKSLVIFGESGSRILNELKDDFPAKHFVRLEDALRFLLMNPALIDAPLLFSPGCASQDEFRNFEHRGQYLFQRLGVLFDQKSSNLDN